MKQSGHLFIVSGPAGSGKTTVCERMLAEVNDVQRVITSTTRPPRGTEVDTVDYYFFSKEVFLEKVAEGAFFEHAKVHQNYYGTLKSEVQNKLEAGIHLLLNIDVQGAAQMRENAQTNPLLQDKMTTVFIAPPSIEELRKRLVGRATDAPEEIENRLRIALQELEHQSAYDYVIESHSREEDFRRLKEIFEAKTMSSG